MRGGVDSRHSELNGTFISRFRHLSLLPKFAAPQAERAVLLIMSIPQEFAISARRSFLRAATPGGLSRARGYIILDDPCFYSFATGTSRIPNPEQSHITSQPPFPPLSRTSSFAELIRKSFSYITFQEPELRLVAHQPKTVAQARHPASPPPPATSPLSSPNNTKHTTPSRRPLCRRL